MNGSKIYILPPPATPEVPPGEQVPLAGRITAAEEASERLPTSPTSTPPRPDPAVTFQVLTLKMHESANRADCVSPFARRVTHQTIPGFSTTGPGGRQWRTFYGSFGDPRPKPHGHKPPLLKREAAIYLAFISQQRVC